MARGPLSEVRILDLTHIWAGPLATRILADLGAQVLKVEAPMGRGPRTFPAITSLGGFIGDPGDEPYNASAVFVKLQRNKKSLALDLKTERGRDTFLQLVAVCDVVIENFSARALHRLSLDYPQLKKANRRIIHVAMPGFGLSGPYRDRVAFGPTVEPMSGLPFVMGYSENEPRATAMALPDPISAVNATTAVMTALRHRVNTGRGCQVELSLHESAVSYSGPWLLETQQQANLTRLGNRHPEMCPHGIYPCAGNDNWIAIACLDDVTWSSLVQLIRYGESAWDLQQRFAHQSEIDSAISAFTEKRSCTQALAELQESSIAAGPVYNTAQMCANPQSVARGFFVPLEKGIPMPGNPVKMQSTSSADWTPSPKLGMHNEEVLGEWLGYDEPTIASLYQAGVIVNKPPH